MSAEPADGNWLALEPDAYFVIIRRLVSDWEQTDEDGRVRYVISRQDPDVQNWLDTAGLLEGSFLARWTYCDDYPSGISSRAIKLADLDKHVPTETPRVDPEERARTIAVRQAAISRRYAGAS